MGRGPRSLTAAELASLQEKKAALAEEMASTGLYFVKWTAAGLCAGVLSAGILRLRGGKAYVPMLALGSAGSIADFAEAHRTTQPLREKMAVVGGAIDRPNDLKARRAAVDAGLLPRGVLLPEGDDQSAGGAGDGSGLRA